MTLPFSIEDLEKAVEAGDVTKRPHPSLPYFIYNYSPEVQFSKKWNPVTLNCRGLILDEDYEIVARPWKKFFNLGEVELGFQFTDPVEVMDKADGSLGILYPHIVENVEVFDIHWKVSTRGSFRSEQAIRATKMYRDKYSNFDPLPGYTMLFEIIYPSNRIVLDYGDTEDLVLLGAVENETGYYHGPEQARCYWTERGPRRAAMWPGPVVDVYPYADITTAIGEMGRKNKEGYVVRRNNFLVKIKEPDYLDLHRLVTNCSPKTVWDKLKDGRSKSEIVSAFPDEFHGMVEGFVDPLIATYEQHLMGIMASYEYCIKQATAKFGSTPTRAEFASVFKRHPQAKFFFLLLDNRPISEVLWASLKPTADKE